MLCYEKLSFKELSRKMVRGERLDIKEKMKKVEIYLKFYFSYILKLSSHLSKGSKLSNDKQMYPTSAKCVIYGNCLKRGREISVKEMKRILDEVKNWENTKYVSFVGGEAFIRMKDTLELIKYANSLGFHTNLVSNATLSK